MKLLSLLHNLLHFQDYIRLITILGIIEQETYQGVKKYILMNFQIFYERKKINREI